MLMALSTKVSVTYLAFHVPISASRGHHHIVLACLEYRVSGRSPDNISLWSTRSIVEASTSQINDSDLVMILSGSPSYPCALPILWSFFLPKKENKGVYIL